MMVLVQTLGIGHLPHDVTGSRAVIIRDAIKDLFRLSAAGPVPHVRRAEAGRAHQRVARDTPVLCLPVGLLRLSRLRSARAAHDATGSTPDYFEVLRALALTFRVHHLWCRTRNCHCHCHALPVLRCMEEVAALLRTCAAQLAHLQRA